MYQWERIGKRWKSLRKYNSFMIPRIISFIKKAIDFLENLKIQYVFFIFLFAITARNLLEFSLYYNTFPPNLVEGFERMIHYDLYYVALAMSIIVIFYLVIKEEIIKIIKVVLPSFLILNIVPLIDFFVFNGKEKFYGITYFIPGFHFDILKRFFTFFGKHTAIGVTPGIRIEIFIVLVISFIYFYTKQVKLFKNIFGVLILYSTIYISFCSLFIVKFLVESMNYKYEYSHKLMMIYLLPIIFFLEITINYIYKKNLKTP